MFAPGGNDRARGQDPEGGSGPFPFHARPHRVQAGNTRLSIVRGNGTRIRVAIIDSHQLVSESLAALIDAEDDMQVVGSASSVAGAASMPASAPPEVVVLEYHLEDGTGQEAAASMRSRFPDARFVILSREDSDAARLAAVETGASAFLHKSSPASEVIAAIREVALGVSLISPAMVASLVSRGKERDHLRDSLSSRELEVLRLMADGVGTREMAQRLGISYSTVRTHVSSISTKLGTRSMVSTVVAARELELIS